MYLQHGGCAIFPRIGIAQLHGRFDAAAPGQRDKSCEDGQPADGRHHSLFGPQKQTVWELITDQQRDRKTCSNSETIAALNVLLLFYVQTSPLPPHPVRATQTVTKTRTWPYVCLIAGDVATSVRGEQSAIGRLPQNINSQLVRCTAPA